MSLTLTQERALAIVPKFSASLGLPSGLFLIYEILNAEKKKESNSMLRALMGVSIFEVMDAFGWFMSTWFVPEGSFAYAAGSKSTCNFQGFLLQVVVGAPMYNCALAYYFYLIVKGGKSAEYLESIENYIHAGIITFAVFTAFLLLGIGQYNHVGAVCWVIGSPADCGNSSFKSMYEDVPCDRGDWAYLYGMVLFYIPLWCSIFLIFYFNARNYKELQGTSEGKWFAIQSLLYCTAFCVTWAPSTTWSAMHWNGSSSYALDLAAGFFEPLAAFWNLMIFLRNRPQARQKLVRIICCDWIFGTGSDDEQEEEEVFGKDNTPSRPSPKTAINTKSSCKTDSGSEPEI